MWTETTEELNIYNKKICSRKSTLLSLYIYMSYIIIIVLNSVTIVVAIIIIIDTIKEIGDEGLFGCV